MKGEASAGVCSPVGTHPHPRPHTQHRSPETSQLPHVQRHTGLRHGPARIHGALRAAEALPTGGTPLLPAG